MAPHDPVHVLDMLEAGDSIHVEDAPTIDFAGRTWFVHNFAGNKSKAVMMLDTSPERPQCLGDIIEAYLLAAVTVAVFSTDWSKASPPAAMAGLLQMLGDRFEAVHTIHMRTLAARKPS